MRRVYCVGRNCAEHIREMGGDEREPPFFFQKPTDAIVEDGAVVPYTTTDVESSAVCPVAERSGEAPQARVLKVVRTTGARQRATDLARAAIRDWEDFMVAKNVSP